MTTATKPRLSVIICTHNPDATNLGRTLAALRAQDLPLDQWELLVIDNASTDPLTPRLNLDWHPAARVSRENTLGLSHARLHGLNLSQADLIVCVDDDNLLAADYLSCALSIAETRPDLGAWGGSVEGEFTTPPEPWIKPYLYGLAIRSVRRESSHNTLAIDDSTPIGAGMIVRRRVYESYRTLCAESSLRLSLDRVGSSFSSGGDTDLALTAIDIGLSVGVFPGLRLTHLIPARRLEAAYVARLLEGIETSSHLVLHLRDSAYRPSCPPPWAEILLRWRMRHMAPERRLIESALIRGRRNAARQIRQLNSAA